MHLNEARTKEKLVAVCVLSPLCRTSLTAVTSRHVDVLTIFLHRMLADQNNFTMAICHTYTMYITNILWVGTFYFSMFCLYAFFISVCNFYLDKTSSLTNTTCTRVCTVYRVELWCKHYYTCTFNQHHSKQNLCSLVL